MKKRSLSKMLAIGAVSIAVLFGIFPSANATFVIDYSNSVTQVNADGQGTFGSDSNDYYQVSLWVYNDSDHPSTETATNLIYNTDLETRGAYDIHDGYNAWTFDSSPTGQDRYNFNGQNLVPSANNTLDFKVKANDVLGWEKTEVYLDSNGGERATLEASIPIVRQMQSSNGASFGLLYDLSLVVNTNSTASYQAASRIDSDVDGQYNWQEYIAGTQPNDPSSYFTVAITNNTTLIWDTIANREYQIMCTTNLTYAMQPLSISPTNGMYQIPTTNAAAFYQIKVFLK